MYLDMNLYLQVLHLTLEIWRPHRDREGWRMKGEKLNMAEMDRKWKKMEERDNTSLVKGVPMIKGDLKVLRNFT